MKKILFSMAAAAMLLAGCSNDEEAVLGGQMRLSINPTIANPHVMPRQATRVSDTDFEQGDKVGLRVKMTDNGEEFLSNEPMVYDAAQGVFTSSKTWYEDINRTSDLFAYYPYTEGAALPAEFAVKADQSGEGYMQSDLIIAVKLGVAPSKVATQMTFKHKMARLIIDIKSNTSGSEVSKVEIEGAAGEGSVNLDNGEVTVKSGAAPMSVVAHTATAGKMYYALIMPQNGVKMNVKITTADGAARTYSLQTTDLKSGENRRLSTNVEPAGIKVAFSGPIDQWIDGDDLVVDGGETPTDENVVEWGGVKYKTVTLSNGQVWMAENLRYLPAGKIASSNPADGSGVWLPCNLKQEADASRVATDGYYYSYPVLLGIAGEKFTAENYNQYEGVQGICPKGWHIPTEADWRKVTDMGSPFYTDNQKGAYLPLMNEAGMNVKGYGYINGATAAAAPAYLAVESKAEAGAFGMAYFASSTGMSIDFNTKDNPTSGIKKITYKAAMVTYNTSYNRLTVANQMAHGAAPVRCVKD